MYIKKKSPEKQKENRLSTILGIAVIFYSMAYSNPTGIPEDKCFQVENLSSEK